MREIKEAIEVMFKSVANTIILRLELIRKRKAYNKASQLRGRIDFNIDLDISRERAS